VPIEYVKQELPGYLQLGVMPSIDETTQPTNRYPAFPSSRLTRYIPARPVSPMCCYTGHRTRGAERRLSWMANALRTK
jgi:hypothetical protein